MEKLVRRHRKKYVGEDGKNHTRDYQQAYFIRTEVEAIEDKIDYVPWREVKTGQYGLTDDGYVAKCLKVKEYKSWTGITSIHYTFPFGTMFCQADYEKKKGRKYSKLLWETHRDNSSFSMVSDEPMAKILTKNQRNQNLVKVYALQLIQNGKPDWEVLARIYSPHRSQDGTVIRGVKRFMKKGYMKDMIDKELEKVLDDKGITDSAVLDLLQKASDMATDKKDVGNLLRAIENMIDLRNMKARGGFGRKQQELPPWEQGSIEAGEVSEIDRDITKEIEAHNQEEDNGKSEEKHDREQESKTEES